MMTLRSTATAVLERDLTITDAIETEPYEIPWASEARFFAQVHTLEAPDTTLEFITQISPDGLHWCDLDDSSHEVTETGLATWLVTGFGQWLRVRCRVRGTTPTARLRIYLVGKG